MRIQIFFSGSMMEVTEQQLFTLAEMNVITPDAEIIVDGTRSTAGKVKNIVFGSGAEVQYVPTLVDQDECEEWDESHEEYTQQPQTLSIPDDVAKRLGLSDDRTTARSHLYVTDDDLLHLAGLSLLTEINLCGCNQLTDKGVAHLAGLTQLKKLNLSGCKRITDAALVHIARLTQLKELDIHVCNRITVATAMKLEVTIPGLKIEYTPQSRRVYALSDFTKNCNLPPDIVKRLGLSDDRTEAKCPPDVTDNDLSHLVALPRLYKLNISSCKNITDAGLAHLKELTLLKKLDISYSMQITDVGLVHIKELASLKQLNLSFCRQITDVGLSHISGLPQLEWLNLCECDQLTDKGVAHLAGLKQLRKVYFGRYNKLTNARLAHLEKSTKLKKVYLWECNKITDKEVEQLQYGVAGIEIVFVPDSRTIPLSDDVIKRLGLSDDRTNAKCQDDVTDNDLSHLVTLPRLYKLNTSSCKNITDAGLVHIAALAKLEVLRINRCNQITDAGLAHIATLTKLEVMRINGCNQITDVGLAHIAKLTQLTELELCGCNQITDVGLAHIAKLTRLSELELRGCDQLTDAGLIHLTELAQLRVLNLSRNDKFTETAVMELEDAMPSLLILESDGNNIQRFKTVPISQNDTDSNNVDVNIEDDEDKKDILCETIETATISESHILEDVDSMDSHTILNDQQPNACLMTFTVPYGALENVVFSPDDRFIVASGCAGDIYLWDVNNRDATPKNLHDWSISSERHRHTTNGLCFFKDGKSFFSAGSDGKVYRWDTVSSELLERYLDVELPFDSMSNIGIHTIALSANDEWLAASGYFPKVNACFAIWNLKTKQLCGKQLFADELGRTYYATSVAFSRDNRSILVTGAKEVRLYELENDGTIGNYVVIDFGFEGWSYCGTFSSSERWIMAASDDKTVKVWDVVDNKLYRMFNHPAEVRQAVFSLDERLVLTGCYDGIARLWNLETGKEVCRFEGHSDKIEYGVAISSKGGMVATAGYDGVVKLWKVPQVEPLREH